MNSLIWVLLVRIAITSSTQLGYLDALGHEKDIVASTMPEKMYNLRHAVVNLGNDMDINVEAVLRAKPDVIFFTDYGNEPKGKKTIERAGIRIVMMREWKEQDPLARAGWIRTVAAIVGEEARADSILKAVTTHYNTLRASVRGKKVQVLSGQDYRGTWYVPTKGSYMGRLIEDAGGEVAEGTGSKPMTVESVLRAYLHAPIWIGVQAGSLAELAKQDEKQTWIEAYKRGAVYSWGRRQNAKGANDFWESGAVRADLLLEDIMGAIRGKANGTYIERVR